MKTGHHSDAGKGDRCRPVDRKKWVKNWPRIFRGKHKQLIQMLIKVRREG